MRIKVSKSKTATRSPRQGRDPWDAVREWTDGVVRHFVPRSDVDPVRLCDDPAREACDVTSCLWHAALDPEEAFFIRGAEAKRWGATNYYWRAYAGWILSRAGVLQRGKGASDTAEDRLSRAFQRFDRDSAEYWAVYVEYEFRNRRGPAAVQEFLSELKILRIGPDAERARQGKRSLANTARLANIVRAGEADARDRDWKAKLVRAGLWPIGGDGVTVKAAAAHIADVCGLDPKKVYATLRKKRTKGAGVFVIARRKGTSE